MTELVYAVTLVKQTAVSGKLPIGSRIRPVFRKGYAPEEALRRAFAILQRDRPEENPMDWRPQDEILEQEC